MLGLGGLGKSGIKKSVYVDLEEKDYQRMLEDRDRKIRKLEFKINKLEKMQQTFFKEKPANNQDLKKLTIYQKKIEEELAENDKALDLFVDSAHRIAKVIELLHTHSDLQDESQDMKGLIQIIGSANVSNSILLGSNQDSSDSSSEENMRSLEKELTKKLDDLELVATSFRKSFQEVQKHFIVLEKKNKEMKKELTEDLDQYKSQITEERRKYEQLKKLLEKSETERNDTLNQIASMSMIEGKKEFQKMDRNELVTLTKKLVYRVKDLESEKNQYLRNINRNKEQELEKYKRMLLEVKDIREKSRLGHSYA